MNGYKNIKSNKQMSIVQMHRWINGSMCSGWTQGVVTPRKMSPFRHLGPRCWQISVFLSENGPEVISI